MNAIESPIKLIRLQDQASPLRRRRSASDTHRCARALRCAADLSAVSSAHLRTAENMSEGGTRGGTLTRGKTRPILPREHRRSTLKRRGCSRIALQPTQIERRSGPGDAALRALRAARTRAASAGTHRPYRDAFTPAKLD